MARLNVYGKTRKRFLRGYITEGMILALDYFFTVSKVSDNVSMKIGATGRGFNNSLWDTNFMLPLM